MVIFHYNFLYVMFLKYFKLITTLWIFSTVVLLLFMLIIEMSCLKLLIFFKNISKLTITFLSYNLNVIGLDLWFGMSVFPGLRICMYLMHRYSTWSVLCSCAIGYLFVIDCVRMIIQYNTMKQKCNRKCRLFPSLRSTSFLMWRADLVFRVLCIQFECT